jgi:ATP-dependent DNA helicase DinG
MQKVVAALGAGEDRPGQLAMAAAVAAAIEGGRHLVVQAGTGTGKSLAYLVPALLSGRKVVVATATKALQDQLAIKDLPFLAEHLGAPVEFAVVKGRSNYFCVQRGREVSGGDDQLELDDSVGELGREVAALLAWGKETATGDRAELSFEPRARAWSSVSVSAMDCPGAHRCPSGEACFAEAARRRAEAAQVVVVNTHLYGAHIASGGFVLPEHDVVIFDEAHEVEDVMASSLGLELSAGRFRALARTARGVVDDVGDVEGAGLRWENAVAPWRGKRLPPGLGEEVAGVAQLAADRVNRLLAAAREKDGDDGRKARTLQAAGHLVGDLAFAVQADDSWVAWVEGPPHAPVLRLAPIDVGERLGKDLWDDVVGVLTSATVPPGLPARVGLPAGGHAVLDAGSPFPYETHALLYCAAHLPPPISPTYEAAVHEELEALIRLAEGRTLALFTSWRAMEAAATVMAERLPWPVFTQSDLPKPALVSAFAGDEHASLFATMGFWQGIDVPGAALSQVVIDRIPFPRPDEPLLQARRDRAGPTAFREVDLPRAATLLAQGAGRLIRSATDRGVVAVLDSRLATARYRWDLVRALPPMRRTRHRSDVAAFLAEALASS